MRKILSRIKQKLIGVGLLKPSKRLSLVKLNDKQVILHPDSLNINHFSGWLVDKAIIDSQSANIIKITRNSNIVGETSSSITREDVLASGKGPLVCGYQMRLYWRHFDEGLNKCALVVNEKNVGEIFLYVSTKDLLVGQADELFTLLK
ncbi:hypothetical protein [Alteromonas stellipolaris]|uniref:hypothetical protein n=1 Tax=Alteromonas stellipolaris TaxID=233316 RepID=UPI001DBAB8FC|nr:hypothetical protein [Alteromonas stellipolaris]MBZ2163624.1 hypothetical protein [Alteromonas stellipolaris]